MRRYLEHFLDLCKNRIFCNAVRRDCAFCDYRAASVFPAKLFTGNIMTNPLRRAFPKHCLWQPLGNIYDRYGRPLAVNTVAYCVQVDGSVTFRVEQGGTQDACYRPDRLALGGWTP